MQNRTQGITAEYTRSSNDIRDNSNRGKLPCGARYCHRCNEECGVVVNAYILRDIASESHAEDSCLDRGRLAMPTLALRPQSGTASALSTKPRASPISTTPADRKSTRLNS